MKHLTAVVALLIATTIAVPFSGDPENRIVGGIAAATRQYPYQVSLRSPLNRHFCGGSIIASAWILTAAHCLKNRRCNDIRVVLGTTRLDLGGVTYGISDAYLHENYNPKNNRHDIALLRTASDIQFNDFIRPIALSSSAVPENTLCTLSGWGITSYPSNRLPNELQHVSLRSISYEECRQALPTLPIFPTHLCTTSVAGVGACQGDSGGPLTAHNVQVGIVSWGIPCAKRSPDMFTSVAHYRYWIKKTSGV